MSIACLIVLALLIVTPSAAQVRHILVTSEVVRVASMAARNEGYKVGTDGNFLQEMRTEDGKEPYPGYSSIALYHDAHPVRHYSIRVETGDVVDATDCKIFRYPDLLRFKRDLLRIFGTKEVSLDVIASEIGCDKLNFVPTGVPGRKSK